MAEASTRHLAQRKATPSCSTHGIDQTWWSDGLGRVWAIWPTVLSESGPDLSLRAAPQGLLPGRLLSAA